MSNCTFKADLRPEEQNIALANNLFISCDCEVLCDVCDISNSVFCDLSYHRAFELLR